MALNMKIGKITAVALLGMALALFALPASAQGVRVDLILEDGTVLIYKGKEAGFREGQKLNVARGGRTVGTLEVVKLTPHYAQAKVLTGAKDIQELDAVSAMASGATETKTESKTEKKTETAQEPAEASSGRKGRGAAATEPEPAAAAEQAAPAAASSGSSRRGRGAAAAAPTEPEPAAASASSSRRGRGGSVAAAEPEPAAEPAEQQPQTLAREPFYSVHTGFMFLKHDLPGNVSDSSGSASIGVDYWMHRKKTENDYIVYSVLYSRPVVSTYYSGQSYRYQLKITELSVNYIRDGLSGIAGADGTMYAGLGVGYRNASSKVNASISYDGMGHDYKKSMEGIDYHGILGARFTSKMELKLNYCFDENYYVIDAGYRF
ncbi:MAG: hypothetical protein BWY28_00344 [bacterium ADurb.Bin236]|nr:MAG: hypothetical protein BWY28_00344 [bacterium ADurb.Bin236]